MSNDAVIMLVVCSVVWGIAYWADFLKLYS